MIVLLLSGFAFFIPRFGLTACSAAAVTRWLHPLVGVVMAANFWACSSGCGA